MKTSNKDEKDEKRRPLAEQLSRMQEDLSRRRQEAEEKAACDPKSPFYISGI